MMNDAEAATGLGWEKEVDVNAAPTQRLPDIEGRLMFEGAVAQIGVGRGGPGRFAWCKMTTADEQASLTRSTFDCGKSG